MSAADAARIRTATRDDLPALTDIYNHYVRTSHATFDTVALTVDQRAGWFDEHADQGSHRLLVAECGGAVRGYATSGTLRTKPAYDRSVETTIYLAPDAVGTGIGRALYGTLLDALEAEPRLHRAYAGIAQPNEASVALHRALGFTHLGTYTEVGFKHGRYVDVQWFERRLGE